MRRHVVNAGTVRRKFGKAALIGVFILLVSYFLYLFVTRVFFIQTIEVVGQNIQVIVDNKKIPKNLLFFPSDRIRSEILKDNPLLSDIRFEKIFPHTLKIRPVVRTPFARLLSGDRMVLIDQGGVILTDGDQGLHLPLISLQLPPFRVGETLTTPSLKYVLAFLTGTESYGSPESIVGMDSSAFQVKMGKTDIFITQDKPVAETLTTLQMLIAGFRIKGTLPAVVDLRFDKPVVKL